MWRLMMAMIVVSDGGSVAVVSDHTDWPTQQVCQQMIERLYSTPPTATVGNVKLTIKTNAQCVLVGEVETDDRPRARRGQWPPMFAFPSPRY